MRRREIGEKWAEREKYKDKYEIEGKPQREESFQHLVE